MPNYKLFVFLGGLGLLGGALLPWATLTAPLVGTIEIPGYRGDGLFTGIIGLLVFISALTIKPKPRKFFSRASAIFCVLALLIAAFDLINVSSSAKGVTSGAGIGLWATAIGAVLGIYGGFMRVPGAAPLAAPVVPAPPAPPAA